MIFDGICRKSRSIVHLPVLGVLFLFSPCVLRWVEPVMSPSLLSESQSVNGEDTGRVFIYTLSPSHRYSAHFPARPRPPPFRVPRHVPHGHGDIDTLNRQGDMAFS